jgi:sugar phosphate isomerase/epimerase
VTDPPKPIGLQLYPFREELAADFVGCLARIADIGYVAVEFLGLHGHSSTDAAAITARLGLRTCASHIPLLADDALQGALDEASVLGYAFPVANSSREDCASEQTVQALSARLERSASFFRHHGLCFALHNHSWEFASSIAGRSAWEIIMDQAPTLSAELDTYWSAHGGGTDPAGIVTSYRRRIPLLHVKDGALAETPVHAPVGSGDLDIPAIMRAADPAVVRWVIVDLLEDPQADMFASARESYRYLTVEGLAGGRR